MLFTITPNMTVPCLVSNRPESLTCLTHYLSLADAPLLFVQCLQNVMWAAFKTNRDAQLEHDGSSLGTTTYFNPPAACTLVIHPRPASHITNNHTASNAGMIQDIPAGVLNILNLLGFVKKKNDEQRWTHDALTQHSCSRNFGWRKPKENNGMFTIYPLVIRISSITPSLLLGLWSICSPPIWWF